MDNIDRTVMMSDVKQVAVIDLNTEIIHLRDIVNRHKSPRTEISKQVAADIVRRLAEEHVDRNLLWFTNRTHSTLADLKREFRIELAKVPFSANVLAESEDRIASKINAAIDLPTWEIIHCRWKHTSIALEIGEDFRIVDWMRTRRDAIRES